MSGDKVRAVVEPAGPPMMISGGLRARARRAVMGRRAKQLGAAMHALVSWGRHACTRGEMEHGSRGPHAR